MAGQDRGNVMLRWQEEDGGWELGRPVVVNRNRGQSQTWLVREPGGECYEEQPFDVDGKSGQSLLLVVKIFTHSPDAEWVSLDRLSVHPIREECK